MIDILAAKIVGPHSLHLQFSDGICGTWDATSLLTKGGPLLEPLRDPAEFRRVFVEAGALSWPNGLTLDPAVVRQQIAAPGPSPLSRAA